MPDDAEGLEELLWEHLRNLNSDSHITKIRSGIAEFLSAQGVPVTQELVSEVTRVTGHEFIAELRKRLGWKPPRRRNL
jgi:hypothetical protein